MFAIFNIFGSGKKVQQTESNTMNVMNQLRDQMETLDKRNVHLEKKIKNLNCVYFFAGLSGFPPVSSTAGC